MRKNRVVYRMSVMASLLAIGTFVFAGGGGNRDGSSLSKKKSPEVGTLEQLVQGSVANTTRINKHTY